MTADSFGAVVEMPGVQSALSAIDHKVVDVELNVARRSIDHHNVALAGDTIVTSRGDEVIDSGTIVIVNGRIEPIGSSDSVRVPVGMGAINQSGRGHVGTTVTNATMDRRMLSENTKETS